MLAAIFSKDLKRAKAELVEFQKKYGQATGSLAGKTGRLATILAETLDNPPRLNLSHNDGKSWPTFGGNDDHSASVGVRIPAEWNPQPSQPIIKLPGPEHGHARTPFGHPVVVNDRVYVTDGYTLLGYDLKEPRLLAKSLTLYEKLKVSGERTPPPCPSLTAADGRLYVRAGPSVFNLPASGNGQASESFLICVALTPETNEGLKRLWSIPPPAGDGRLPTVWEGSPQVSGRRMWAAYARFENGRIVHGIACYDPADAAEAPDHAAWAVDVCDSPLTAANEGRTRQELVTLAGRNVIFCSNTGAVVALDAVSGRRAWAYRYPRDGKANPSRFPDAAPAVAFGGRVFVAPADAHRVVALDAETGAFLWDWTSEKAEGVRIMGVAAGRLIVTVSGHEPGIFGLDVVSGSHARTDGGWAQSNNTMPPVRGLGFVTDEKICCPTDGGLYFFDSANGNMDAFSLPIPGGTGNTVYADGRMVLVTANQILIYNSDAKEFNAATLTPAEAVRLRFLRLSARVERELAEHQPDQARAMLAAAARGDLPASYRAWFAARLLLLSPKVEDEREFPDDIRTVLTPELRGEWVIAPDGLPLTLADLVQRRLSRKPADVSAVPIAHRPESKPRFAADLDIERTLRLPPGSAPLPSILGSSCPQRMYFVTLTGIHAVTLAQGEETHYRLDAPITQVAETSDGFVAVGPLTVALYTDGPAPAWTFRFPMTDPLPASAGEIHLYSTENNPTPELSGFRMHGALLLARLGACHLIAFDLQNRRVAWMLGSDRTRGYCLRRLTETPHFGAAFLVGRTSPSCNCPTAGAGSSRPTRDSCRKCPGSRNRRRECCGHRLP